MKIALDILTMIWVVLLETAPYLMLGLLLAGLIKILLRARTARRYLGEPNLKSALWAALLGLPLPICSCGVVPLTLGLRDKGASREARLAFLTSTPETSVDTVVISWGLLGPIMAIARPVAALFASLLAAVVSIAVGNSDDSGTNEKPSQDTTNDAEEDPTAIGFRGLWRSIRAAISSLSSKKDEAPADLKQDASEDHVPLHRVLTSALRYSFVEMFDRISLWLVIGIVIAGAIAAMVPAGWFSQIPGGEMGAMLFMLAISIPMYVCAVESTPIAAMLILKGLSPGAALVFLLAGPATNLATISIIYKSFGRVFLAIYLMTIAFTSVAAGFALNALLAATGWTVLPSDAPMGSAGAGSVFSIFMAVALLVLLGFSFRRLDWRGKAEKIAVFSGHLLSVFGRRQHNRRRRVAVLMICVLAAYLACGIYQVGPSEAGYRIQLGKLVEKDIEPGLHYRLPWPFEEVRIFGVRETRKTDLGFRTDPDLIKKWRENPEIDFDTGWHSFFTISNSKPEESLYLLGDENQLEAKFSVMFEIDDPTAFFFDYAKNRDLVRLTSESVLREHMAKERIDAILTTRRMEISDPARTEIQALLDMYGIGVRILGVYPVDLHPPQRVVSSFRAVASAMEDRETRIHQAHAAGEDALPRTRGEAAKLAAGAEAIAIEKVAQSQGRSVSFEKRLAIYADHPDITRTRMTIETMERVLPGRKKILFPKNLADSGRLRLWGGNSSATLNPEDVME
jgi:HflK protein